MFNFSISNRIRNEIAGAKLRSSSMNDLTTRIQISCLCGINTHLLKAYAGLNCLGIVLNMITETNYMTLYPDIFDEIGQYWKAKNWEKCVVVENFRVFYIKNYV